jgi:hypothetical protein
VAGEHLAIANYDDHNQTEILHKIGILADRPDQPAVDWEAVLEHELKDSAAPNAPRERVVQRILDILGNEDEGKAAELVDAANRARDERAQQQAALEDADKEGSAAQNEQQDKADAGTQIQPGAGDAAAPGTGGATTTAPAPGGGGQTTAGTGGEITSGTGGAGGGAQGGAAK